MNPSPWLLATRPKTLTAALVPIAVGTALAHARGFVLDWRISVLALVSVTFIQIGTNLVNDAIDFKKGADTEKRIGPKRVTQSGLLTPRQVMTGAFVCFALAMATGIPLVIAGGWVIVAIGLLSLLLAYGYTGGPFPLAYLGLGDLFVFLFFGLVAVGGIYFLQSGGWDLSAGVAGAQVGLLATVLIAINNLRDREGDVLVGKRTLAVRLGVTGSRAEILVLCVAPYVLNLYWLQFGLKMAVLLPFFTLPLALRLCLKVLLTAPGPEYNVLLGRAAGLQLLFGLLWSVGAFVGARLLG